jgi:hypothetical protein
VDNPHALDAAFRARKQCGRVSRRARARVEKHGNATLRGWRRRSFPADELDEVATLRSHGGRSVRERHRTRKLSLWRDPTTLKEYDRAFLPRDKPPKQKRVSAKSLGKF